MQKLGRSDLAGGRTQACFAPGQPRTPGCLTSGNSASARPGMARASDAPHRFWSLRVAGSRRSGRRNFSTSSGRSPASLKRQRQPVTVLSETAAGGGFQSLLLPPSPLECEDQILKETDSGVGALRGFPSARLATTGRIAFFRAWGFFPVFIPLFLLLNIK